jgi:hypothetical protein
LPARTGNDEPVVLLVAEVPDPVALEVDHAVGERVVLEDVAAVTPVRSSPDGTALDAIGAISASQGVLGPTAKSVTSVMPITA